MGNIFYLMGKSSSGKDTIFKEVKKELPSLKTVALYTTRPIREGEKEGVEYFFIDEEKCMQLCEKEKVIELRAYNTIHGIWKYLTVHDEQINLRENSYLMIGTLESYEKMREYFGDEIMIPVYICVEDGLRLTRALEREKEQKDPKYAELCRRFLADTDDFSEEKLVGAEIRRKFENIELEKCIEEIVLFIKQKI